MHFRFEWALSGWALIGMVITNSALLLRVELTVSVPVCLSTTIEAEMANPKPLPLPTGAPVAIGLKTTLRNLSAGAVN